MVTGVFTLTCKALSVNVAVAAPGSTATLAWTAAPAVFELDRATTTLSDAGPLKVTVPSARLPPKNPKRLAGAMVTVETEMGGTKVIKPVCVTEPRLAEMLTGVAAATALVATVKVAEVAPAGMVTDALGKKAPAGLSLASATTEPPAGAGPPSFTVPFTVEDPPTTKLESSPIRPSKGGLPMVLRAMYTAVPSTMARSGDPLRSKSPTANHLPPMNKFNPQSMGPPQGAGPPF